MKILFGIPFLLLFFVSVSPARSAPIDVDSVLLNDFVFDSSGSPWLDGWHYIGLRQEDTASFTKDVPPGSRAAWSVILMPGWIPQTSFVSMDYTGLTSGIYQLTVWAKVRSGREGGGGEIAVEKLHAPFTYSGRALLEDTGWHQYTVLDTLSLATADTVRILLTGGSSELASWEDYYNNLTFTKLSNPSDVAPPLGSKNSLTAFPNPCGRFTQITLSSAAADDAEIDIVNMLGQEVAKLFAGALGAGEHRFMWQPQVKACATGMYECVVRMNGTTQTLPIVVQ